MRQNRLTNGNVFVTWERNQDGFNYGKVFLPDGTPLGNEFIIGQNTAESPSVASLMNGNVFVAWQSYLPGILEISGRVFLPGGTALSNEFFISQFLQEGWRFTPSVAGLFNGNAFVAWESNQDGFVPGSWANQPGNSNIYGRFFFPNETALGNEFLINQNTTGIQSYPSVAGLMNGNVFVAWQGDQAGAYDIYGRVLLSNGTALGDEFPVNQNTAGNQEAPSVASLTNGNVFVVWHTGQAGTNDIYGRAFLPNGTALGNEFIINQITTGEQTDPSVASLTNGNVFVTWIGSQTGNPDIYGRIFDIATLASLMNNFTIGSIETTSLSTSGGPGTSGSTPMSQLTSGNPTPSSPVSMSATTNGNTPTSQMVSANPTPPNTEEESRASEASSQSQSSWLVGAALVIGQERF